MGINGNLLKDNFHNTSLKTALSRISFELWRSAQSHLPNVEKIFPVMLRAVTMVNGDTDRHEHLTRKTHLEDDEMACSIFRFSRSLMLGSKSWKRRPGFLNCNRSTSCWSLLFDVCVFSVRSDVYTSKMASNNDQLSTSAKWQTIIISCLHQQNGKQ